MKSKESLKDLKKLKTEKSPEILRNSRKCITNNRKNNSTSRIYYSFKQLKKVYLQKSYTPMVMLVILIQ